ncbi:TPA: hypothetical protein RU586_003088 [Salmonella enterica]|nr:hypothetical protein [Salmonella enterica]
MLPGHAYRASERSGSRSAAGFFLKHFWKPARPPQKNNLMPDGDAQRHQAVHPAP